MKTPTFGLKEFVLVVVELGVVLGCFFEEYCWLVLVWIGFEECL